MPWVWQVLEGAQHLGMRRVGVPHHTKSAPRQHESPDAKAMWGTRVRYCADLGRTTGVIFKVPCTFFSPFWLCVIWSLRFLPLMLDPLLVGPDIHLATHETGRDSEAICKWTWGRLSQALTLIGPYPKAYGTFFLSIGKRSLSQFLLLQFF